LLGCLWPFSLELYRPWAPCPTLLFLAPWLHWSYLYHQAVRSKAQAMSLLNKGLKDKPMLLLRASCCLERALLFDDAGVDFDRSCWLLVTCHLSPTLHLARERAGQSAVTTTSPPR
jgi:hypothetical protein